MTRQLKGRYPGPGGMFALSLGIHLAVFLLIARSQLLREFKPDETPVTYVDMVTLPVASPQSGTPAPAEPAAPHPAAAAPAAVTPPAAMALPAAKPKATAAKPKATVATPSAPKAKPEKPAPVDEAKAYNDRLAKIERQAEEKRQADVMERLKNKGGRTGMPGGKGTEAGSDYRSYLQSRLQVAFKKVVASQSKSPEVIATITIGTDGRIAEYRVEQKSGDPLFDDAVARAVNIAGTSLKPPPGGVQFKRVFRFRPEEGRPEGVGVR